MFILLEGAAGGVSEITRSSVRDLVRKGLKEARGNYKIVARMFNMEDSEYKRFLNFLRKHDCQLPFQDYRSDWDRTSAGSGARVPAPSRGTG